MESPLVLALDTDDLEQALAWSRAAGEAAGMVKAGLELFGAAGPAAVAALAGDGRRVMLDLKLHDIPATVAGGDAGRRPGRGRAGHRPRPRRAGHAGGRRPGRRRPLPGGRGDDPDQRRPGRPGRRRPPPGRRGRAPAGRPGRPLAAARRSSARPSRWPPCAPSSAPRSSSSAPGSARPRSPASSDDQARVATPAEAIAAGASRIVVGRPITRSDDVGAAARAVRDQALAAGPEEGGDERANRLKATDAQGRFDGL